jgi:parallel beta-helix repeat protein
MNKPVAIATFVMLLFLSTVCTVIPVSSQTSPSYVNACILEDGTVQGTSNIKHDGNQYTFTGDVIGALVVKKDNIVIDGQGYTLTSNRARGIVLENRSGVTLKNTRITLNGGYVIDLRQASNCIIVGNTLVGTPELDAVFPDAKLIGPIGINFLQSKNITIKDNTVTNFGTAFSLNGSSDLVITGNTLTDGLTGIDIMDTTDCFLRNNRLNNCSFSVRAYSTYQYISFGHLETLLMVNPLFTGLT